MITKLMKSMMVLVTVACLALVFQSDAAVNKRKALPELPYPEVQSNEPVVPVRVVRIIVRPVVRPPVVRNESEQIERDAADIMDALRINARRNNLAGVGAAQAEMERRNNEEADRIVASFFPNGTQQ